MMVVLLIGGIGVLLAGLLTVGLGIQMDLSFGNTLILSGTVAACAGAIMLSLWAAVRELRKIALRLGLSVPEGTRAAPGAPRDQAPEKGGFSFSRDLPSVEDVDHAELPAPSTAPWQEAAARDRGPSVPEPVDGGVCTDGAGSRPGESTTIGLDSGLRPVAISDPIRGAELRPTM